MYMYSRDRFFAYANGFKSALLCLGLLAVSCQAANVWYVNADNYGKTGLTGKNETLAYGTIQDAIRSASSGDTIYVAPGVYDKGLGGHVETWGPARIGWNNKKLFIYSTGDASNTFIVGQKSNDTTEGNGADAVRCFAQYNNNSTSYGSILKGFTFCGGGAPNGAPGQTQKSGIGGAIALDTPNAYFVDCVISNCSAETTGIVNGGSYIRCLFTRNTSKKGSTAFSGLSASYPTLLYACVVHHNINGVDYYNSTAGGILLHLVVGVNCTVADNSFGSCCYGTASAYNTVFYNTVFFQSGALNGYCCYTNCVVNERSVMSTIHPDVRLISGCGAQTAGDGKYLARITLPEGLDYKDYGGNTPNSSGTIAAGATQTAITPAAGAIVTQGGETCIDGTGRCKQSAGSYVYPDTYPTQYHFTAFASNGSRPRFFQFNDKLVEEYDYRFPSRNDDLWVMPPPNPGTAITNNSTAVAAVSYVDPNADASVADGSAEHPFRTLQAAYNTARDKVIVAKAGVYGTDADDFTDTPYGLSRLFCDSMVRITSEEGPEKTFIVGAASTDANADAYGRGTGAIRCITHRYNPIQLQGFTLTGGRTEAGDSAKNKGGGAYSINGYMNLDSCIISNNCATEAGGAYGGRLCYCLVTENHGDDFAVSAGNYYACIMRGNTMLRPQNGVIGSSCRIVHCTVIGDKLANRNPYYNSTSTPSHRFASVFLGGDTANASGSSYGNVCWDLLTVSDTAALVADPLLADPDNGDLHPFYASPAYYRTSEFIAGPYWYFVRTDYEGIPIHSNGGRPAAGAFITPTSRRLVAIRAENGGLSSSDTRTEMASDGTLHLAVGEGTRPFRGVVVGGATNLATSTAWSMDISGENAAGGISVVALYGNDWYAATNGSDSASGFFPDDAKTLQGALSNAALASGDRVLALPGTYGSGKMLQSGTDDIHSRAVVPGGITLESTDGRDATIIAGAKAEIADADPTGRSLDVKGMGTNAIRCVYLSTGAKIKGFTLTNGWTRAAKYGTDVKHSDPDTCGGGIKSYGLGGIAEDCLVTGCGAYRGGGAFATVCRNCTFAGNYALYAGGATSDSRHYGCLTYGNSAMSATAAQGFFYIRGAVNCTCIDSLAQGYGTERTGITNTVVAGAFYRTANIALEDISHSFFNTNKLSGVSAEDFINSNASRAITTNEMVFDGNYRPVIGRNACVDAGDNDMHAVLPGSDLSGTQRVYNGALDVGALEADWRTAYARDISPSSRFSVAAAGRDVVESAAKTVRLAPGEALAAAWRGLAGRNVKATVSVRVTGTGTLTVTQADGTPIGTVVAADGDTSLEYVVPSSGIGLDFAYTLADGDTGYAEIFGSAVNIGTTLVFR